MLGEYRQKNIKLERCKQIVFIDFPNNLYCHHTSDNIYKGPGNSKNNSTLGINHKTAVIYWRMDKTSQCNSILSPIIVTLISSRYLSHLLNYVWSSASQQLTRRWIIFNLSFSQENILTKTYIPSVYSLHTIHLDRDFMHFYHQYLAWFNVDMFLHYVVTWTRTLTMLELPQWVFALKVKCFPLPHTNRCACLRDVFQILDHSTKL